MKSLKYKELQVIKTIKSYENILEGALGTILFIYQNENEPVYEIEFIDENDNFIEGTLAESYLTDQI